MPQVKHAAGTYTAVLIAIFVLFAPFAVQVLPWFEWSDGCEHLAAIKELSHSLQQPKNPHLDLPGTTSPRFVPSIILMALLQRVSGMDIFTVQACMSVVMFFVFGLGIYLFAKEYFQDSTQPVYTLLCILFLWGKGWDGANGYMFSSLVFTAYYPSVVSFAGIFIALTALLKYARQRKPVFSCFYIVLSTLIVLNHPLTGFLFLLISFLLVLGEKPVQKRNFFLFALSCCISIAVTVLWPYYSIIESIFFVAGNKAQEFWDYRATHQFLYSELLIRIGPCLLGVPPILYWGARRKYLFIVSGFALCSVMYALGYVFGISLGERCIFFCMLFSQLAFSRCLKLLIHTECLFKSLGVQRFVTACCIAALLFGTAVQLYLVYKVYLPQCIVWKPAVQLKPYQNPLQKYFILSNYLHRDDIVLTDVFTSWIIPCVADAKVVSLLHNSPLVSDNAARLADSMIFFAAPYANQIILKKYRTTHILINKNKIPVTREQIEDSRFFVPYPDAHLMGQLAGFGRVVLDDENFFLVEVGSLPATS